MVGLKVNQHERLLKYNTMADSSLFVFHHGYGGNGELWYNKFANNTWAGDVFVPGTGISASPVAVLFLSILYVFHQGLANNGQLWYNEFNGVRWSGDVQVPGVEMTSSPSAVVWDNQIYVSHQG